MRICHIPPGNPAQTKTKLVTLDWINHRLAHHDGSLYPFAMGDDCKKVKKHHKKHEGDDDDDDRDDDSDDVANNHDRENEHEHDNAAGNGGSEGNNKG